MPAPLTYIARCAAGTCVKLTEDADLGGFIGTSTIDSNDGAVFWTYGELAQYFDDVKAGALDIIHARCIDQSGGPNAYKAGMTSGGKTSESDVMAGQMLLL